MAVPQAMTTKDITGRFTLNKSLSEDYDIILTNQGVNWFTRSAIAYATVTLDISHFRTDEGVERITIDQTITGGIKGTTESRTLDWTERSHRDHIFGSVLGKSRRVQLGEVEDEYLKTGWTEGLCKEGLIESYVLCEENAWTATQIWGFEEVNGEKRYVRRIKFEKDGVERINRKLIYDYIGPTPAPATTTTTTAE
ncbi:hypothetical protein K440DRAFT_586396 [Wilcoxina mikolae CBS 423.85]|nr:hypothetical protein K440DRAFT_586396 [Wilcoxina mikolae CBS 423.85]